MSICLKNLLVSWFLILLLLGIAGCYEQLDSDPNRDPTVRKTSLAPADMLLKKGALDEEQEELKRKQRVEKWKSRNKAKIQLEV